MALFVTGLIMGGLISWVITHIYYNKSSQDQRNIYNKLTEDVKSMILEDKRESLSIKELNELINKKATIEDSDDIYPYRYCPKCGSEDISRYTDHVVDGEMEDDIPSYTATPFEVVECKQCGWQESELADFYKKHKPGL